MERKKGGFGRVMLLYALFFLLALSAMLGVLYASLRAEAQNGPDAAARAWLDSLDGSRLRVLAEDWLAAFDAELFPPEELFAQKLTPLLGEELSVVLCEETDEKAVYEIRAGEQRLGAITARPGEERKMGRHVWRIADEDFDFSFLGGPVSLSLTVPEGFSVLCGEKTLDARYEDGRESGCDALVFLEEAGYARPVFVRYRAERCPPDAVLTALSPEGERFDADTDFEALAEARLWNSCTAAERQALERFSADFCAAYVNFLGSHTGNVGGTYRQILPLLLPGSDLESRISSARSGLAWSSNRSQQFSSLAFNGCMKLGEGQYLCDVRFTVELAARSGPVQAELGAYLFVQEADGALYAAQLFLHDRTVRE